MNKEKISITEQKYSGSTLLLAGSYCLTFMIGLPFQNVIKAAPIVVHIYDLLKSINDRHAFESKVNQLDRFIKKDFIANNTQYIFEKVHKSYGLSLIDIQSITGLISNLISYSLPHFIESLHHYIKHNLGLNEKYAFTYQNIVDFGKKMNTIMWTLATVNLMFGSGYSKIDFIYNTTQNFNHNQYMNDGIYTISDCNIQYDEFSE